MIDGETRNRPRGGNPVDRVRTGRDATELRRSARFAMPRNSLSAKFIGRRPAFSVPGRVRRLEAHDSSLCAEGLCRIASSSHTTDWLAAASAASREEYAASERYPTGVHAPRSSASRLNSWNPQVPSGRENKSTHRSCSKFSILRKTNQDLSIRSDTALPVVCPREAADSRSTDSAPRRPSPRSE